MMIRKQTVLQTMSFSCHGVGSQVVMEETCGNRKPTSWFSLSHPKKAGSYDSPPSIWTSLTDHMQEEKKDTCIYLDSCEFIVQLEVPSPGGTKK
jgi:hypothetical protein